MRPRNRLRSLTLTLTVFLALSPCHGGDGAKTVENQGDRGGSAQDSPLAGPGIIVESVMKDFPAERAGITEGDVLLSWKRDTHGGTIDSPFDLFLLDQDEGPQGPITFEGLRGQEPRSWLLPGGSPVITARPNLRAALLAYYRQGVELKNAGKAIQAAQVWLAAADASQKIGQLRLQVWFLTLAADLFASSGEWKAADDAYQTALQSSAPLGLAVREQLFWDWGQAFHHRSDWDKAAALYQQGLIESQKSGAENIGALMLTVLGFIANSRGDLGEAEEYFRKALTIREKLEPNTPVAGYGSINLGMPLVERGELSQAEEYEQRALRIFDRFPRESGALAVVLNNLGEIARYRRDLPAAEEYFRQALAIIRQRAPNEGREMVILGNLGNVADLGGNQKEAREYLEKSLAIAQRISPGTLEESTVLRNLGSVAVNSGNFTEAVEDYNLSLKIYHQLAPDSLDAAEAMQALGDLARRSGDTQKAKAYYESALTVCEKTAPGSMQHAESLAAVGSILVDKQQPDAAARYYAQAVNALESEGTRLGGSEEIRSGFRAKHSQIYRDYVDLLLAQKQPARALEVLERSRARILLEMLTAARVDVHKGADPSLLEQEGSLRQTLAAKSDRRLQLLGDKGQQKQLAALTAEIEDLSKEYLEVEERLRSDSPAYAGLTQPQPLTAGEIQRLLDADTTLLEYSLGEERSYVFAVTGDSITVRELPKREVIESLARRVFELLQHRNQTSGESTGQRQAAWAKADADYIHAAHLLSQMILEPVAPRMPGKRLLIVSEGSLQYIPFAALPALDSTSNDKPGWTPLLAEHEVVSLPSASVLAALRHDWDGRKPAPSTVAVFADPVFSAEDGRVRHSVRERLRSEVASNTGLAVESQPDDKTGLTRSALEVGATRGGVFPRLRFSRLEADAIESIAHRHDATEALDFNASKAAATSSTLKNYRILHFATHGLVNSQHADLSGLVFSLVDKNGQTAGRLCAPNRYL
jgi:tetratricopeptide (TPR) repeat protein